MIARILEMAEYHARHAHTEEQRGVAAHFAAQMTRRPDQIARQAQAFQPIPPQTYHAEPVKPIRYDVVLFCAAAIFTLPLALYGAVKLGGEIVRLALGVM